MFMEILPALLVVAAVGLLAGILLALASHFFCVEEDETAKRLRECLPGINCGACGYKGCDDYAASMAQGTAAPNLCVPGAGTVAEKLSGILGVDARETKNNVAFVTCNGNCEATSKKADYRGIDTCQGASMLYGGPNACLYGCIGLGDCARVCPADAICVLDGIAHVDSSKCLGCGLCVKTCPKQVIVMVPQAVSTLVMCNNREKGAEARKNCTNACIGCKKCEKNCSAGAITVTDNLARIDFDKCTGCGICVEGCPTQCLKSVCFSDLSECS
ncbi:MAG: RnfABCDGE type electron transport complex subunit B [Clostridia bacterium]|nr:RnfABCDGE type electron transport complex subunit B [Clostridia bacterium]